MVAESHEVLGAVAVELDLLVDGFAGVLVELVFDGNEYALIETALGSGNRLMRFHSQDREMILALFEAELSGGSTEGAA
jgi:hypothetical protein